MPRVSRPVIALILTTALVAAACGEGTANPAVSKAPTAASPAAVVTTPAPTPTPTPKPTPATTPLPTPSAAPSPTATPAPAVVALTIDAPVWALEAPLVLKGGAGTTTWSDVMFASKTATLRWTGTPADKAGCTLALALASKALPRTLKASARTANAKPAKGSKSVAVKYGDGALTVTTDCATFSVKVVPTGHPGVTIKRATDQTRTKATDATGLNEALAKAHTDWWLSTRYGYRGTSRPSVVSKKVTADVTYELPSWKPPSGTDPQLVTDWKAAMAGMKKHEQGEAAIAVQAAGRYLASLTKSKFASVRAMKKYFDAQGEKWIDWANKRTQAYNESTDWGTTQAAFIQ